MSDGSIKFDTKVDTSGVKQGKKQIDKELSGIDKIANKVKNSLKNALKLNKKDAQIDLKYSAQKPQSFFKDNIKDEEYAIKSISAELNEARSRLAELQSMSAEGNFSGIDDAIKKATDQVRVYEQALEQAKTNLTQNQEWLAERVEIDKTKKKVDELQAKMDRMNATGVSQSSRSYKNLAYDLNKAKASLDAMTHETNTAGVNISSLDAEFRQIGKSADNSAKKITKAYGKQVPSAVKRSSNSLKYFSRMIMSMFVMSALFGLMSTFTKGMQDMAKVCPDVNSNLSQIMSSLSYLKNSFLAAFSPLIGIVVPIINTICGALATLLQYISMVFSILSGKSTYKVAAKQQKDYAASLDNTAGSAKNAEKALASFDEINQLNLQSSSGGGGAGDAGAFEDLPVSEQLANKIKKIFDDILNVLKKIADIFKAGFMEGLGKGWKAQLNDILNNLKVIKKELAEIFTDPEVIGSILNFGESFIFMLGALTGSAASIAITTAQAWIGGIAKYLQRNSGTIKTALINTFQGLSLSASSIAGIAAAIAAIFSVVGGEAGQTFISEMLETFLNSKMLLITALSMLLGEGLSSISTIISSNIPAIQEALLSFIEIITIPFIMLSSLVDQAFSSFMNVWTLYIQPFIQNVVTGINTIISALLLLWNTYLAPTLLAIGTMLLETWNTYILPIFNQLLVLFGQVINFIGIIWQQYLAPLVAWILTTMGPTISNVLMAIGTAFNGFLQTVSSVVSSILTALSGIITFLTGVFTGDWEMAWMGVQDIFKGVFNGIITIAESAINFIIDCLNGLSFDVPDWVPLAGGMHFGFSLGHVSLPRLATGTVVPPNAGEFAAILGDNKQETEIVSPLSTMKEALAEVLAEYSQDIHLEVNGSLASLIRLLKIELSKEDKRKGKKLVVV